MANVRRVLILSLFFLVLTSCSSDPEELFVAEEVDPVGVAADDFAAEAGDEDDAEENFASADSGESSRESALLPPGSMWWVAWHDGVPVPSPRPSVTFGDGTATYAVDGCEMTMRVSFNARLSQMLVDGECDTRFETGPIDVRALAQGWVEIDGGSNVVLEPITFESNPPIGGWDLESLFASERGSLFYDAVDSTGELLDSGDPDRPVVSLVIDEEGDEARVVMFSRPAGPTGNPEQLCFSPAIGFLQSSGDRWTVSAAADPEQQALFEFDLADMKRDFCFYDDASTALLLAGEFDLAFERRRLVLTPQAGDPIVFLINPAEDR